MGDLLSKIKEDRDDYLRLCEKFHENPVRRDPGTGWNEPDCYGIHAQELEQRERKEMREMFRERDFGRW